MPVRPKPPEAEEDHLCALIRALDRDTVERVLDDAGVDLSKYDLDALETYAHKERLDRRNEKRPVANRTLRTWRTHLLDYFEKKEDAGDDNFLNLTIDHG